MNEYNGRAQTARSKSSFLLQDRKIKSNEKSKKNMDIYTKKVCDFKIKVKIEKNEEGLKKVKKNLNHLSMSNENLSKLQNRETKLLESKSKEIAYLNLNVDNCYKANEELKSYINELFKKRKILESDQKAIADYCNNLKNKFKNIEKTIEEYEREVDGMKTDNDKILVDYEDNIAQMTRENEDLLDVLNARQKIYETQNNQIRELDIKTNILIKDIEDQKNYYSERETLNQIKYDELEKKFNYLLKKVYEFQVNEDIKRIESGRGPMKIPDSSFQMKEDFLTQMNNMNMENIDLSNKIKTAKMEVILQQTYLEQEAVDKKTFRSSSFNKTK